MKNQKLLEAKNLESQIIFANNSVKYNRSKALKFENCKKGVLKDNLFHKNFNIKLYSQEEGDKDLVPGKIHQCAGDFPAKVYDAIKGNHLYLGK